MCRKRASGIRASKKSFKGEKKCQGLRKDKICPPPQKKNFRNKSFKKELQRGKKCQGLHEDEICRKRASGIRASKKELQGEIERQGLCEDEIRRKRASRLRASKRSFKGEKSVRDCAKTNFAEKSFRNKSFKKELQGEKKCQGLHEDKICRKRASGIRASKRSFKGK